MLAVPRRSLSVRLSCVRSEILPCPVLDYPTWMSALQSLALACKALGTMCMNVEKLNVGRVQELMQAGPSGRGFSG